MHSRRAVYYTYLKIYNDYYALWGYSCTKCTAASKDRLGKFAYSSDVKPSRTSSGHLLDSSWDTWGSRKQDERGPWLLLHEQTSTNGGEGDAWWDNKAIYWWNSWAAMEERKQNQISSEDEVWPFRGKANDIVAFFLQLIDRDTHLCFWEGGSKRNNRTMIWQASTEERDLVVGFRNSFPHGGRRWASSMPRRISLHRKWLSRLNLSISGEARRSAERKIISHKQCSISSITLQPFFAASCKVSAFSESARRPNSETSRAWCAKGIHEWVWAMRKEWWLIWVFPSPISGVTHWCDGLFAPRRCKKNSRNLLKPAFNCVALGPVGPFLHWGRHTLMISRIMVRPSRLVHEKGGLTAESMVRMNRGNERTASVNEWV